MSDQKTEKTVVDSLIERARVAQKVAEGYSQERVLELARAIALTAIGNARKWAELTMEETGLGDLQSKINRINDRPRGVMRDLLTAKTVGVIEVDEKRDLIKLGKPVGVIGAIVPMTVPETVPVIKGMNSIMGRNATVFSPHPRSKKITAIVVNEMRATMKRFGAPEDLFLCIENPTLDQSQELMRKCDLVIATGGQGLVKAAYSSGTPAYGVGTGNVVSVVEESADVAAAAEKIIGSKINDLATGCSTENSILVQKTVYGAFIKAMQANGAKLCDAGEKAKLQNVLWADGHLNGSLICRPAPVIAKAAGIAVPADCNVLMVEEDGYGPDYPFSGEKLSVVLTVYRYDGFDDAVARVNAIQAYQGAGHSCGIHSANEDHIMQFALRTKTARVMINSPQNKANAGSFKNGMPFTISLGCGTWGGNSASENITYKHYINTTWVARWHEEWVQPDDKTLFGDVLAKF
ncbi:Sulfoacetaldehyde dehydrogenase (acylating) [uncultured delta proteobacterium]|uniref:Sulfoacetaldehyde dehydrogenase (Acylating) n=1 Tax=uncultured delta proteobacterium TaxID=34034 RepID=A0A212JC49_9DELT|nr:Sulfoacetaldehyde dehydrogenase (acylating) [uncultured delta proteobacterium]